jgi:hypothetical protein
MSLNFKPQRSVVATNPKALALSDRTVLTIGSKTSLSPGFNIAGIIIQNTSGSFMLLEPMHVYVPPYTLGWIYDPIPTTQYLEITWPSGPLGAQSTIGGESPVIYLYDEPIGYDAGLTLIPTPYGYSFTANNTSMGVGVSSLGGQSILATPPAGRRYRIFKVNSAVYNAAGVATTDSVIFQYLTNGTFGTLPYIYHGCTPTNPTQTDTNVPTGFDLPLTGSFQVSFTRVSPTAAVVNMNWSVIYTLI